MDCNGSVQVADAVLLARYVAEDNVNVTAQGKINANCYNDGTDNLSAEDIGSILKLLAGVLKKDEMPERA